MRGEKAVVILLLLLLISFSLFSQNVVQKVSKQEKKIFDSSIENIEVWGEKANIEVFGWEQDKIEVTITPISRNAIQQKAIEDLQFIKYTYKEIGNKLEIRNFYHGKNQKITSNLSVSIQVCLPKKIPIKITNLYGAVSCSLLESLDANIVFGRFDLVDHHGSAHLKLKYTDSNLINTKGRIFITSEKSDLTLKQHRAKTICETKYGAVNVQNLGRKASLTISGQNSDFHLKTEIPNDFNYTLKTSKGKISVPFEIDKKALQFQRFTSNSVGSVEVSTTYANISIEKTPTHYDKAKNK